ncbi:MAG: DNA mismatch repair protein MutS [Clostridiales bacterium]|nr:DNA mismatch repair protein MutS [Clostridiales bacterium]
MAISPMMSHYLETKTKYPDAVLFYRLGDFYEMFFEDAELCARELELTLTGKDCGLEKRAPMCGIPHHAAEGYIARLLDKGYKVAVCEQLTEPKKGVKIVERDVVRVITPGTIIDSSMLDENKNNYIASIYKEKDNIGISIIDISTGKFIVTEFTGDNILSQTNDYLVSVRPSEVILNNEMKSYYDMLPGVVAQFLPISQIYDDEHYEYDNSLSILKKQLNTDSLKKYNINNRQYSITSAGALLDYITETQKRLLTHINDVEFFAMNNYMQIDANSRRNLELLENFKDRKKKGSLFWILNKTKTSMGSRLLKTYIEQPLFNDKLINYRLNAVEELVKNIVIREKIGDILYNIYDIERLCGRISYNNLVASDCIILKNSLRALPELKDLLSKFTSTGLTNIRENIYEFNDIVDLLERAIVDKNNEKMSKKDMEIIKYGYNKELDEYIDIAKSGKVWISELEAKEKQLTNIKNLKVSYNKVFGYYIEVPNSQASSIPYHYIRRQTLANAERYVTDELKQIEEKIINAESLKISLEKQLFDEIRNVLLAKIDTMKITAKAVAELDTFLSFATIAVERNYCKPIINKNIKNIEILGGRHPVIEITNKSEDFIPNDTILNSEDSRTMIITGPNMAGKSTYMRQVALITLLAHIGSFVPATSAKICLTDRIFTRIGASDDLSMGQSTFMVEMSEVSHILKNATNDSLIILDEVGRGTSTFDGLSIAWAVIEHISKNLKAKTLFSTHYHELTELEGLLDGVKNYKISVKEFNNSIIFLRKIVRGGASRSFGIEVASLAGLPTSVLDRARSILHILEQNDLTRENHLTSNLDENYAQKNIENNKNIKKITGILGDLDVNTLTPLNAFDILIQLKNYLKKE